jgi:hypothetical protein
MQNKRTGRFLPGLRKEHRGAYSSWHCMLLRVDQKTSVGRYVGVQVDQKWREFENFLLDMGDRPEGMSLDRIDNSKGYFKDNCRWATVKQQILNTKNSIKVTDGKEVKTLKDWCEGLNINYKAIWARIRTCGWSIDEALCTPTTNSTHYKRISLNIYKEVI